MPRCLAEQAEVNADDAAIARALKEGTPVTKPADRVFLIRAKGAAPPRSCSADPTADE